MFTIAYNPSEVFNTSILISSILIKNMVQQVSDFVLYYQTHRSERVNNNK